MLYKFYSRLTKDLSLGRDIRSVYSAAEKVDSDKYLVMDFIKEKTTLTCNPYEAIIIWDSINSREFDNIHYNSFVRVI